MTQLTKEEQKQIIKEAHKEWLDSQFAAFGRWAFWGLVAAFFSAVITFILQYTPFIKR